MSSNLRKPPLQICFLSVSMWWPVSRTTPITLPSIMHTLTHLLSHRSTQVPSVTISKTIASETVTQGSPCEGCSPLLWDPSRWRKLAAYCEPVVASNQPCKRTKPSPPAHAPAPPSLGRRPPKDGHLLRTRGARHTQLSHARMTSHLRKCM